MGNGARLIGGLVLACALSVGCAKRSAGDTGQAERACNGHASLCDRALPKVAFPATHNGHAALDAGFSVFNANHERTMANQLEDGVRAILLDLYEEDGERVLCHGPCSLGRTPHVEALESFATFLKAHPSEVVILLYEGVSDLAAFEEDYQQSGLRDVVMARQEGEPWPTLGESLDAGEQLLVTMNASNPEGDWLHGFYDLGFDTPYDYASLDEFSCEVLRGSAEHDLFLINHWVNTPVGLPSVDNAAEVNQLDVLLDRARACETFYGRIPNLIAVDFYEQGDLFDAVRALNGLP